MRVTIFNNISRAFLQNAIGDFEEVTLDDNPEVIFVRSENLKGATLPNSLLSICPAGSGVDNIPMEQCNERGIVVFNAPGANANAVKELVILAMIAALRNIRAAFDLVDEFLQPNSKINLEMAKRQLRGEELFGKSILIIGLGKIGRLLAKACNDLGMNVYGYDPYVPTEETPGIVRLSSLKALPQKLSFISLHQNLTAETKGMIGEEFFSQLRGVILLNFAREGLVNLYALRTALQEHKVRMYVSDFPNKTLAIEFPKQTLFFPHLGASTEEAEKTSLAMVINQLINFLKEGQIYNSPNFPDCALPKRAGARLLFSNHNIPGVISSVTAILSQRNCNVAAMINESKGDVAYNIVDIDNPPPDLPAITTIIAKVPAVTKVRLII
jgi:D-3-phosphoglycerate dehydrogenase